MKFIFLVLSFSLLISHALFFLRAFILRNRIFKPKSIDKVSRNIATALIIPTLIIGSITLKNPLLSLVIWFPFLLLVLSMFNRGYVIKHPYTLPLINLILIVLITILAILEVICH